MRPEALAQSRSIKLYKACGCTVLVTSDTRRSRNTPGTPDLMVFHPIRWFHFFHEVKAAGGKLSAKQRALHEIIRSSGMDVIVGDETVAAAHLKHVMNDDF